MISVDGDMSTNDSCFLLSNGLAGNEKIMSEGEEGYIIFKKALSIVSISDHMFRPEALNALERQESFNEMMEISLETAWRQA